MFKPIKEAWGKSSNSANLPLSYTPSKPYGLTEDIDEVLAMTTTDLYDSMRKVQEEYVSGEFHNPQATYLPFRRYLVDWMSDIGEQFNLHPTTIHTSILYLDKIFREQEGKPCPPRNKWQLLATACISVASKYEEAEEHCPPIPELLEVTKLYQSGQTPLSFRDGESEVLDYLHWTLRAVCPLHVVGYYLSKGVTFEEDRWQGRKLIEKIPKYVKKYAEFFCNLTLQEYTFQKYEPSHLASAIIMASRVALNLEPKWRPDLASLTGYEEADIEPCFEHVFSYYEEQFPGHGSRSNSPKNVTDL
ncbi:hypothetical protein TrLO_g7345 [Triparma laevis f. longispina]|uniref:Cyclin N-terminal domain-containing protein n=1 Tax=Triparma laevis f. longispina TaxID=1714387 RepID=A0A9W7FMT0_9STRA|nr:hypothetical protein TrLO_g7345 [Triparma laevis f. longispina]